MTEKDMGAGNAENGLCQLNGTVEQVIFPARTPAMRSVTSGRKKMSF